jgi:hypothetical protein
MSAELWASHTQQAGPEQEPPLQIRLSCSPGMVDFCYNCFRFLSFFSFLPWLLNLMLYSGLGGETWGLATARSFLPLAERAVGEGMA